MLNSMGCPQLSPPILINQILLDFHPEKENSPLLVLKFDLTAAEESSCCIARCLTERLYIVSMDLSAPVAATLCEKQKDDSNLEAPKGCPTQPPSPLPAPFESIHSRNSPGCEKARVGREGVTLDEKMWPKKAERGSRDAGKVAIPKGEGLGGGRGGREGRRGGLLLGMRISYLLRSPRSL